MREAEASPAAFEPVAANADQVWPLPPIAASMSRFEELIPNVNYLTRDRNGAA